MKTKKKRTRLLSILLVLVMVVGLMPTVALAAEPAAPDFGGSTIYANGFPILIEAGETIGTTIKYDSDKTAPYDYETVLTENNKNALTVYAGGNEKTINTAASVLMTGGNIGTIYGGGFTEGGSISVNSVEITINGGNVGNIYGGGYSKYYKYDGGCGGRSSVTTATITVNGGVVGMLCASAQFAGRDCSNSVSNAKISVAGGTIKDIKENDGKANNAVGNTVNVTSFVITGGSIASSNISLTPTNGETTPQNVSKNEITFKDKDEANIVPNEMLSTLITDAGYIYGMKDVKTDANGKIYVWLPDGASVSGAISASSDEYKTGSAAGVLKRKATYTVSFDANGGSGTMSDINDVSGEYTLPENSFTAPDGMKFKGWATSSNGTVISTATIDVSADTTLYAIWEDIQKPVIKGLTGGKTYCDAVEFEVSDNVGVASVKVGDTNLTATNGKYTLNKGIGTVTVVAADNAGNTAQVSVIVNNGHTYGTWQSNSNNTHTRCCTIDGCNSSEDGNCEGGTATYFKKAVCEKCNTEYGTLLSDSTVPTGEISLGTDKWNKFLNTITFGLFFKNTQSVTITASDDSYTHAGYTSDKAVTVKYYLYSGDTALTKAELASKEFKLYNGSFNIDPDNKYVIYVMLTDHAGNIEYISSDGIVLDATLPVITGIADGKTYCSAQTVTVTEAYFGSVTVNNNAVTLDSNNQFTLNPAEGTQTIVVTDNAGNSASVTVTVNNGHTPKADDGDCTTAIQCNFCGAITTAAKDHDFTGTWVKDDTNHWHKCQNAGCNQIDTKASHSGSDDGDCTTAVVCECNHVITAAKTHDFTGALSKDDTHHWHKCQNAGCNQTDKKIEHSASDDDDCTTAVVCQCGATIKDAKETHNWNEWTKGSYADTHTHKCQNIGCEASETKSCTGGTATCISKATCDYCGNEYGEIDSNNHNLENIPAKNATVTETGNKEYWHCKDCDKNFSDKDGKNSIDLKDTVIAKLPLKIIEGTGQSIESGVKKELTFRSNAEFSDFIRVELDGKTLDAKYYTAKEGSTIVTLKADYAATLSAGEHTIGIVSTSGTATTKFTVNEKTAPKTGDANNIIVWLALIFMSGAGVIGTAGYGKKKRAK